MRCRSLLNWWDAAGGGHPHLWAATQHLPNMMLVLVMPAHWLVEGWSPSSDILQFIALLLAPPRYLRPVMHRARGFRQTIVLSLQLCHGHPLCGFLWRKYDNVATSSLLGEKSGCCYSPLFSGLGIIVSLILSSRSLGSSFLSFCASRLKSLGMVFSWTRGHMLLFMTSISWSGDRTLQSDYIVPATLQV